MVTGNLRMAMSATVCLAWVGVLSGGPVARAEDVGKEVKKAVNQAKHEAAKVGGKIAKEVGKVEDKAHAMMESWKKAGTPGVPHANLKQLAGTWTVQATSWMQPDAKPEQSKGTDKSEVILGGRFVRSTYVGTFGGQPFNGEGILGYNNTSKKYESFWMDSMSTGMMFSEGTADKTGKVITFSGDYVCPMTHKAKKSKSILRLIDAKKYIFEMYDRDSKGKEFKTMELVYTRAS